jgi:hypothetical protein
MVIVKFDEVLFISYEEFGFVLDIKPEFQVIGYSHSLDFLVESTAKLDS